MIDYDYKRPGSVEEAMDLLREYGPRASIIAGGTDVMTRIRGGRFAPEVLVSIRGLGELSYIKKDENYHIGALTTHRMLEKSELVKSELSALNDGASWVGSVQIRNVATIGGNLVNAAPSADTAGPLLAYGATMVVMGPGGKRRVPVEEFFLGPGKTAMKKEEVLLEIEIPGEIGDYGSAYFKHTRRKAMELPLVGVSVAIRPGDSGQIDDARISLTVAAPTPVRAFKAEQYLKGKTLSDDALSEAGKIAASPDCCSPRDSLRCDAWYRQEMISVSVARMARLAAERIKNR